MNILASYFHDLSPFALRFSDSFGIRWYGLSYLAGFVVAYITLRALAVRGKVLIPPQRVGDAMIWLIAGTIVGGRLGYCVFYDPMLLITWLDHVPFWGVLAINEGGMASHGGMVGLTLACWRVSRGFDDGTGKKIGRVPMLHIMDAVALACPAGLFFGRMANFINGELLGRIVAAPGQTGPWWSVQFAQELDQPRKLLQQTPEQWEKLENLASQIAPGASPVRAMYTLSQSGGKYASQLSGLISSRHPSQIYQAVAEGLVVGAIVWVFWRLPRKPGLVTAVFLMAYGVLRVVTELWRLPDANLAVQRVMGLSRGQWLSVVMVIIGAGLYWWASRRERPAMGGWGKPGESAS